MLAVPVRAMSRWLSVIGWYMLVGNVALLLVSWILGERLDAPEEPGERWGTDKAA